MAANQAWDESGFRSGWPTFGIKLQPTRLCVAHADHDNLSISTLELDSIRPSCNFRPAKELLRSLKRQGWNSPGLHGRISFFNGAGSQYDVFYLQKCQNDFTQSSRFPYRDCTVSLQNAQELQPLQARKEGPRFRECPSWCRCGKCRLADSFWEQLCCRKTDGACVTTSPLFEQLVLSRSVLEFVLLYRDPLLDLRAGVANKPFRHCAYERYVHWRFGEGDLGARAVIPNCCRWRIRDAFPSENGEYSGLGKK